jgi:competence CoiA-like predicted nuclease
MIRAINKLTNQEVTSNNIDDYFFIIQNKKDFICPNCKEPVIFANCQFKIKHFRHTKEHKCNSEPETKQHLEMKQFFIEKYKEFNPITEYKIGSNIADVFVRDLNLSIECQFSNIQLKDWIERNRRYEENGIRVLWIFHSNLLKKRISVLFKHIKNINYQRIYFYINGKIIPIYYKPTGRWIENNFVGDSYYKWYKTIKDVFYGKEIIQFDVIDILETNLVRFYDKYPEELKKDG